MSLFAPSGWANLLARVFVDDRARDSVVGPDEGEPASEQVVEDHPNGVEIGAGVDRPLGDPLGGCVRERADEGPVSQLAARRLEVDRDGRAHALGDAVDLDVVSALRRCPKTRRRSRGSFGCRQAHDFARDHTITLGQERAEAQPRM